MINKLFASCSIKWGSSIVHNSAFIDIKFCKWNSCTCYSHNVFCLAMTTICHSGPLSSGRHVPRQLQNLDAAALIALAQRWAECRWQSLSEQHQRWLISICENVGINKVNRWVPNMYTFGRPLLRFTTTVRASGTTSALSWGSAASWQSSSSDYRKKIR